MLNQVAGAGGLESLETPAPQAAMESTLEGAAASSPQFVAEAALQKIKSGQAISPAEAGALEAIVIPDKRPVVFIRGGRYGNVPLADWSFLNAPEAQNRLNPLLASIGRIELPQTPNIPYGGTGFVVGPQLLMTNRHVARLFADGCGTRVVYRPGGSAIDLKREIDSQPNPAELLDVIDVVMIHPFWDMALIKVASLPASAAPLSLGVEAPEDLLDQDVVVVGYPAQDFRNDLGVQNQVFEGKFGVKRLAPGKVRRREPIQSFENVVSAMTHDSSTLGGNSGSAVIQASTGKVVALHFAGEYLKANYCVPIYELARDTRVVDQGLTFDKAVAPTTDWLAAWRLADGGEAPAASAAPAAGSAAPPARPAAPSVRASTGVLPAAGVAAPSTAAGGNVATVNFYLPIQVAVTVGTPIAAGAPLAADGAVAAAPPAAAPPAAEVEKVPVIYPDLSSRTGYQPDFLGLADGVTVPLPSLTAAGAATAARLEDGSHELKYHKFSIVVHKQRRMALFTAANVDWRESQREIDGRKPSRKELNGFTRDEREDWMIDSRIPLDHQLPDYFYSKDGGAFDKGHLVRRDDVAWGSTFEDMQMGNGDTFHTTNCSPQTAEFNRPGDMNWGALEKMVEDETAAEKVCVFSGPVLDEGDQFFHGLIKSRVPVSVQIPQRYWKIIVANVGGQPAAYGFVLDQDLSDVDLHAEMAIPDAWKDYLRPISEIESYLNGLARLPELRSWDQYDVVKSGGSESVAAGGAAAASPAATVGAGATAAADFRFSESSMASMASPSAAAASGANPDKWCFCWLADNPYATGTPKAALVKATMWRPGEIITIAFLDGDAAVQARVRQEAVKWTRNFGGPANVVFSFVADPSQADIRVSFQRPGSWSVLGKTCRNVTPKSEPTMNYGWLTPASTDDELRRVVLHEFGHALGMVHEHLSSNVNILWNKPQVYADLSGPPNNWDRAKIDVNMFNAFAAREMNASRFDKDSIMLYPIPARWTTDGFSSGLNVALSAMDVDFMRIQYP
jgi:endonuclease G